MMKWKKGGNFYHNEVYYFHLLMSIDQFDYNNNSNDLKEKGGTTINIEKNA